MNQIRSINFFFFLLCTLLLCSALPGEKISQENEYNAYLSELIDAFSNQIESEYGIRVYGTIGRMHKKIKQLGLQLQANRRATIDEARALHLAVLNRYVDAINADSKLQPFLKISPFTHEQVEISISYRGINGPQSDGSIYRSLNVSYPDEDSPKVISEIIFYVEDPYAYESKIVLNESYEEALQNNLASGVSDLAAHQSTPKEEAIDALFLGFKERMYRKHQLECWRIGGDLQDKFESVGAKFVALQRANQAEARKLLLDIAQNILDDLNSNEALKPYFVEEEFSLDRLKVKLCFKKKGLYTTYKDGSMESVQLEDGMITYFQKTPRKKGEIITVIPIETPVYATESYQEALVALKK